ncbi:MAG: hypothetical protein JW774_02820 [Candidatus Aureabacteria bacterium]|nr:hypothetical protein [Candidatus Auribacterota bacterium]
MRQSWIKIIILYAVLNSFYTTAFSRDIQPKKAKILIERGNIVSIDKINHTISIQNSKSIETKTYQVSVQNLANLKEGQEVNIEFQEGTSIAKSVKITKAIKAPKSLSMPKLSKPHNQQQNQNNL